MHRRPLCLGLLAPLLAGAAPARAASDPAVPAIPDDTEALLRRGGLVFAMRHAQAPGTFDPPGFRLGDCRTQRNLDETGRDQARRIGAWFRHRRLSPTAVLTSPWCRCRDTAHEAFGGSKDWPALGSPSGANETTNARHLDQLRRRLAGRRGQPGFEVWVTHMFVLSALVGQGTASGEGLLLEASADGVVGVLGRAQLF